MSAEHVYQVWLESVPRGRNWVYAKCSCGWQSHEWGSVHEAHKEGQEHIKEMSSPDQRTERPSQP